jgi:hypothetical protein
LLGKAWDAVSDPLLRIRMADTVNVLDAISKVEIWCRREDLLIENIKVKDETLFSRILFSPGYENKMAAVEAYIRNALASKNLDIRNFSDPFGQIKLADVAVVPLVDP